MHRLPRTIYGLALATACLMVGTPLAVLLGGIIGAKMAPSPAFATLPIAAMVVGLALAAYPAAKALNRYGQRLLFTGAALLSLSSTTLVILALSLQSFTLWLVAMGLVGVVGACSQQMRFAGAAYVAANPAQIPLALSVFMLAGVIAAIIGPELALVPSFWGLREYAAGFIFAAGLQIVALITVWFLPVAPELKAGDEQGRVAQPKTQALLAIVASVTGYGIMSFIMTATPISMHEHQGHDLVATKSVIQWHILAMFLPSFFTGSIIKRYGIKFTLWLGAGLFVLVAAITLSGLTISHYALGLILLGIGWNLLFTAGSTLAAQNPDKGFRGRHDATVFAIQAVASLSAGFVLHLLGWQSMQILALTALLPLIILLCLPAKAQTLAQQVTD